VGSFLGAVGLLPVVHIASIYLMREYPLVFRRDDFHSLFGFTTFGFAFIVFGLVQVWRSLAPFGELRGRLGAVRDGADKQIGGQ